MAADETHAHGLAGEHAVVGEGGLFLGRVEALGVVEETGGAEVIGVGV